MNKKPVFYFLVIAIFGFFVWIILHKGQELEVSKVHKHLVDSTHLHLPKSVTGTAPKLSFEDNPTAFFSEEILHNLKHPLSVLLLQIVSIILVARLFSILARKIGQPTVIGEIVAGIALGPSLLGMFLPEVALFVFPKGSLPNLQFLSQIGLIIFMFIIGMELEINNLRSKAHEAVIISHASIIFPYSLGVGLSYFLYERFAPPETPFIVFGLFMGIATSITAFPVLARIIQERGLTKTPLGIMAITCAAADDVTAWCILASVIAVVKAGSATSAIFTIILTIGYVLFMIYAVQPFIRRMGSIYVSQENLNKSVIAVVFLILLSSAYVAEIIGIHALFGAFLAGAIMPQNIQFKKVLTEKIEDISLVVLLPLFFVFTGLRTHIGLLNTWEMWGICSVIIFISVLGKLGGSAVAARFVGQSWSNSFAIGALMNTRGLMELIVLNIGYDLGILSQEIFTMMVLMALATTFMTGPLLNVIEKAARKGRPKDEISFPPRILLSFGPPKMGSTLLRLAAFFADRKVSKITALHMTPDSEISSQEAAVFEKEGFQYVNEVAADLSLPVTTCYKATEEVVKEMIATANQGNFTLFLMGAAKTLFNENLLGGKVRDVLEGVVCDVGVLVDRNFIDPKNMMMVFSSPKDEFLVFYAHLLIENDSPNLNILNMNALDDATQEGLGNSVHITHHNRLEKSFAESFSLIIISYDYWKQLIENRNNDVLSGCSLLVIKPSRKVRAHNE